MWLAVTDPWRVIALIITLRLTIPPPTPHPRPSFARRLGNNIVVCATWAAPGWIFLKCPAIIVASALTHIHNRLRGNTDLLRYSFESAPHFLHSAFPCHSLFFSVHLLFTSFLLFSFRLYVNPCFVSEARISYSRFHKAHYAKLASFLCSILRDSTFTSLFLLAPQLEDSLLLPFNRMEMETVRQTLCSNCARLSREADREMHQRGVGEMFTGKGGRLDMQPPPNPRAATPTPPHAHPDPPSPE